MVALKTIVHYIHNGKNLDPKSPNCIRGLRLHILKIDFTSDSMKPIGKHNTKKLDFLNEIILFLAKSEWEFLDVDLDKETQILSF